jgi:hypothetical protein
MWVLIISLYLTQPYGQIQSKGIIQAPQRSYEACMHERERIRATWYTEGYRVSPRCIFIKNYQ